MPIIKSKINAKQTQTQTAKNKIPNQEMYNTNYNQTNNTNYKNTKAIIIAQHLTQNPNTQAMQINHT